jgi:hypothetical protein
MNRIAIEIDADADQDRMWLELGSKGSAVFATANWGNFRSSMLAQSKIEGVILKFNVSRAKSFRLGACAGTVSLRRT